MKLKQQYAWAVGTTFAASGAFYLWQNDWATAGGHIALPKALWLGLTIFYWLILPPLLLRLPLSRPAQRIWQIFWALMLLRAILEMWLLYGLGAWKYAYGIAHDGVSAIWLFWGAWRFRQTHALAESPHMSVMAMMFMMEMGFAYYISHFNAQHIHAKLWFIGWEAPHLPNQIITCLCVLFLIFWMKKLAILFRNTS